MQNKIQYKKRLIRILKKNYKKVGVLIMSLFFSAIIISSTLTTNAKNTEVEEVYGKYKYYTSIEIQPGDSCWSIAEQYAPEGFSISKYIDELKFMNHLKSDKIMAGDNLMIFYYSDEYKK